MTDIKPSRDCVLIVDDDYDTRDMLSNLLRGNGYRVLSAVDREEALAILSETPVHTILLDYMMPGPNVTTFLDALASTNPGIEIILMTAGDRVDAVADTLGLQRYIGKPYDEATLLRMLRWEANGLPKRSPRLWQPGRRISAEDILGPTCGIETPI